MLEELKCSNNQLSSLDVSNNQLVDVTWPLGEMTILVPMLQVDLSEYAGLDISKMSNLLGGRLDGTILSFMSDMVTYDYKCGEDASGNDIILKVAWTRGSQPLPSGPILTAGDLSVSSKPFSVVRNGWAANADGS